MASSARLDELKKKFEENPRRYFAPLANEHRKSGDLDQAIALCRTHLPQQPGHISGHIVLAQALFEAGSLDESREIFHTALGLDPENLIALRYLGDIAKETADIETARSWYQRVLEVDPRNEEIVQLVRDLDAPRPAPGEPTADPAAADDPTRFAPASASRGEPEPAASADSNARFAPLSLDEVDLDDSFSVSEASEPSPNDATPAPAHDTYDAHAAWSIGESTAEMPMLDAPDIDPFDLDPSGSVESLYDPNAVPSSDDFFLTELAGASAPADGSEPETPHPSDAWAAQPTAESAPAEAERAESQAAESHAAESHATETQATSDEAFDDGAFYLEPPPPEPAQPAASEQLPSFDTGAAASSPATDASEQVDMPGMDAFAAEYYVPHDEPAEVVARSTGPHAIVHEPEPNADVVSLAEQQTAEWQPLVEDVAMAAHSAPSDDLGLEVMEFVPPSSESAPPSIIAAAPDADPVLGRTLSAASTEQSSTPAAFVTETMAELYLQQGFRNEALAVYRELLARNPADASLRDRIDQIESGSMSSIGMASVSENVVESAIKRQQARPARSVRSFFASLAGRRAPAREYPGEATWDVSIEQLDSEVSQPEAQAATEPVTAPDVVGTPEPTAEQAPLLREDRITPLASAAETLATFDPFGEPSVSTPPATPAPDPTPNAASAPAPGVATSVSRPTPMAMPAQTPPSALTMPESSARRSLEDLFPDTPTTARTETAAETLATAFGRQEPQGRPTRAASNELSLDHVFRGTPEGAPAAEGGFSFDQFFSDSRASSGDVAAPAATAPETGRSGSGDAHDIEQFTAWLEGLKKK